MIPMDTLRRRALALGAKVEGPSGTFNDKRMVAKVPRPMPTQPPPAQPAPVPPELVRCMTEATDSMQQFAAASYLLHQHLVSQVQEEEREEQPKPRKWRFTVNRNAAGDIVSIDAEAKE